ncbi:MAG: AzlD domain-containing protein [candidate division NC10 bacterium]|nr:AzlD domain-containing protein [candidate division NC10 bacterium]
MRIEVALIILGMAAVTYVTRAGFTVTLRDRPLPGPIERWLRHVPLAILAALAIPGLLFTGGAVDLPGLAPRLVGGVLTFWLARRTRNLFAAVAAGVLAYLGALRLLT